LDASPGTRAAFDDSDSPQSLALDWLSKNQFLASYTAEQVLQRFVMATLYFSTEGESWQASDLWLSDSDECEWWSSETQADVCNGSGQLHEIDDSGLSGSLPWIELAVLGQQLIILEIFANQVSGSLSSTIGGLSSLIVLDLQRNGFAGTIPREIEQLQSLKHLVLADNEFSGTIPTELAGVTGLESLNLSGNSFEGSIPDELGSLSALRNVFLVSKMKKVKYMVFSHSRAHKSRLLRMATTSWVPSHRSFVLKIWRIW
jgi:Leucine Rich Repeat